jgi:hypothetical protein
MARLKLALHSLMGRIAFQLNNGVPGWAPSTQELDVGICL